MFIRGYDIKVSFQSVVEEHYFHIEKRSNLILYHICGVLSQDVCVGGIWPMFGYTSAPEGWKS